MDFELFVTKGLGDNSYLVVSGKEAAMVDPQRDIGRFAKIIDERDLDLKFIAETHVHNDYISGALELKDRYNSGKVELALPALGNYEYEHKKMHEGDILQLGDLEFHVINTPGHTYEHISWLVQQNNDIQAAFTGGSLIVGSAGRTDLLGPEHTHELTKLQYETVMRMKKYPSEMDILPTHGAGSFCTSSNPSDNRTSKLRDELRFNQAITSPSLEEFLDRQLSGLRRYPAYYPNMAPINRKGPKVYGEVPIPSALNLSEFKKQMESSVVVDIRLGTDFAKHHIPNSYNFQYASSMGNYIGWVLDFNQPIIVVADEPMKEKITDLATQLFRIGFEKVLGYLDGGIQTWIDERLAVSSYDSIIASSASGKIHPENILDVRDPVEFQERHLENSSNVFIGDIDRIQKLERKNWYVTCVSGQRAATSASLLKMNNINPTLITNGGIEELLKN